MACGGYRHPLPIMPQDGLVALENGNIGWFEFTFVSPHTGWRQLVLDGRSHLGKVELEVDAPSPDATNEMPQSGALLPGQWVWLTAGVHRLRILSNYWTGLPQISSIRFEAPEAGQPGSFRLVANNNQAVTSIGQCRTIQTLTGGSSHSARIEVSFRIDGRFQRKDAIDVEPSAEPVIKSVPVPCDQAGEFRQYDGREPISRVTGNQSSL